MKTHTQEGLAEPITFHNPPTVSVDGHRHLTDEAARVLSERVAQRYSGLLARLAAE